MSFSLRLLSAVSWVNTVSAAVCLRLHTIRAQNIIVQPQ